MAEGKSSDSQTTGLGIIIIVIVVIGIINQVTGGSFLEGDESWINGGTNSGSNYVPPKTEEGIQREIYRIGDDIESLRKEAEKDKRVGATSPLFKKLKISTGDVYTDNPDYEYISIYYDKDNKDKLLLSGMEIRSAISGKGVIIGNGVNRPNFSRSNVVEPIYLNPGDTVYITSGKSTFAYSFRVNKCTGFFAQFHSFSPSLYTSCPLPREKTKPYTPLKYREACYNYIESISACYMPINDIPEDIGPECTEFVTSEIGYDKCVEENKFDRDFYQSEWRVFLDRPEELWLSGREMIKLLDQNKRTVDYIEY